MWGLFKRKAKSCTDADAQGLILLFSGSGAVTPDALKKRVGTTIISATKALMSSPVFRLQVLDPLLLGLTPHNTFYSDEEKHLLSATLEKHFSGSVLVGESHLSALYAALNSPRFLRVLEAIYPALDSAWLKGQLLTHEKTQAIPYTAHLEEVRNGQVTGYVFKETAPEEKLSLLIYVNGIYLGNTSTGHSRRDAEEKHKVGASSGFEHILHLPEHLTKHNTLLLHIFDAATLQPVCAAHKFTPVNGQGPYYIQRLVSDIHGIKEAGNSTHLETKLDDVLRYLPDIQQYAAFDRSHYDTYKTLYGEPLAPEPAANMPTISIATSDTEMMTAPSDLILFAPAGCKVGEAAQKWFCHAAAENPDAQIFFSDYKIIGASDPENSLVLGGQFDPDLLMQTACYAQAFAIRRHMLEEVSGLRQNMKGALWYDLWLRVFAGRGTQAFHHIPQVLFELTPITVEPTASQAALKSYLNSQVINADVVAHNDQYGGALAEATALYWPIDPETPKLAIIIPTRDQKDLLETCLTSLRNTLAYPYATEIIIVDNGSQQEETKKWLRNADNMDGVRVIVEDTAFNWSALNNKAVAACSAEYLLFLNNDTAALEHGWDKVLRGHLNRPDIGCIGARLLFEDGTIQYAGYVLDSDTIVLKEGYGETTAKGGYLNRTKLTHTTSAVIGAFLACRREVYEDVAGFDAQNFAVAFNDVDFSLAVSVKGYRNVYCPQITFHHYESKSRSYDHMDTAKRTRVQTEKQAILGKWSAQIAHDPWYPPSFLSCEPTHRLLRAPVSDMKVSVKL